MNSEDFFREVTLRICGSLDIDQAFGRAFDYIKDHIPADTMALGFSDLNSRRIRVLTSVAAEGARYVWKDGGPEIALSDEQIGFIQDPDRPPSITVNRPGERRYSACFPNSSPTPPFSCS